MIVNVLVGGGLDVFEPYDWFYFVGAVLGAGLPMVIGILIFSAYGLFGGYFGA